MVHVIFRDEVKSPYPVAAKGTLNLPADSELEDHIGRLVPFAITIDYSDFPIGVNSEGVVARVGTQQFYEYKVMQMAQKSGGYPRTGQLVIRGKAST